jgi:two-component system, cell cycle response regulator DivK
MSNRILLVEDNEQNRYLATFLLENAGYVVRHAPNGRLALEAAAAEKPDLILMDIQMPEMDGYEAARRLLATPGLSGVPLVAITSYAMVGDRERALSNGFADYIEKPIDPDLFIHQIRAFLRGKEAQP